MVLSVHPMMPARKNRDATFTYLASIAAAAAASFDFVFNNVEAASFDFVFNNVSVDC
jgi:hypothetical protein